MKNKSDFLDQMRFDVGLVPDYACTLKEFYLGILNAIGKNMHNGDSIGLFLVRDHKFQLIASIGKVHCSEREGFGEGDLSVCAIRGKVIVKEKGFLKRMFMPFYDGHHLKGILVINIPLHTYTISEEDLLFLQELSRFIEMQHTRYKRL